MRYEPFLTPDARDDLRRLDKQAADRIAAKIDWYCATDKPLFFAKPLTGDYSGSYRFRIGAYRVVFDVKPNGDVIILWIFKINHRKDVYT